MCKHFHLAFSRITHSLASRTCCLLGKIYKRMDNFFSFFTTTTTDTAAARGGSGEPEFCIHLDGVNKHAILLTILIASLIATTLAFEGGRRPLRSGVIFVVLWLTTPIRLLCFWLYNLCFSLYKKIKGKEEKKKE